MAAQGKAVSLPLSICLLNGSKRAMKGSVSLPQYFERQRKRKERQCLSPSREESLVTIENPPSCHRFCPGDGVPAALLGACAVDESSVILLALSLHSY